MLQSIKAKVGKPSGVRVAIDAKDSTLIPKFVESYFQIAILVALVSIAL
jgi:hypothetical protein